MGKKSDRNGELNYGVVADRKVGIMHVYRYGNMEADIVLIQLAGNHDISEIKDEVAEIQHLTSMDFELIAVKVDDWNKELSPWKTPAVFGNEDFGDGAVQTLEEILWNEIGTKDDYEAEYGQKPLGEFVREIVGLDMNAAKAAFSEFLDETNLDSRQIYFVNQIVEYIVHNGVMKDLSVLQEPPFTDHGSVVEIFTDMNVWMGIRKVIDTINSNASA